ncbi:MAG: heavy metal-binding domain-containing protein, partial [Streptosporangiaceae bacterium]
MSEELPAGAVARAVGAWPGGMWGSALTCQEFVAVRGVGFEPVGQVFGAAVYAAGCARGYSCPGAWGSSGDRSPAGTATQLSGRGDAGSFGPLVEAMYRARQTAIDRMTAECAALGGHGVVGVRLSRGSLPLSGLDFTATGSAVRATGASHGQRALFTCDVSGQDFAKLISAGWVPAGLAAGISI